MKGLKPPTSSKYDSRDFSKNARTFFKKGASSHLRELQGRAPRIESWIRLYLRCITLHCAKWPMRFDIFMIVTMNK